MIPSAVKAELTASRAPEEVKHWSTRFPHWIEVCDDPPDQAEDASLINLDAGEKAAIRLALHLGANLVLIDDQLARSAASRKELLAMGTLGVLNEADRKGLVDLASAFAQLRRTNFRCPLQVMEALLSQRRR